MDDTASIEKFLAAMSSGPNIQPDKYSSRTIEPQNSSNEIAKETTSILKVPSAELSDDDMEYTRRTPSISVETPQEVSATNNAQAKSPPKPGHVDWYKDLKDRMDVIRKAQRPMDPRLTQSYSPIPPEYEERCVVARDTIQQVLESYSPKSRPSSSHSSQGQENTMRGFTRTKTLASKTSSPKKIPVRSEQSTIAESKRTRVEKPSSERGEDWVAPHLRVSNKENRDKDMSKVNAEQITPSYSNTTKENTQNAQQNETEPRLSHPTPHLQALNSASPTKDVSNEPLSLNNTAATVPQPAILQNTTATPQSAPSNVIPTKEPEVETSREGVLYFKSWGAPQQRERAGICASFPSYVLASVTNHTFLSNQRPASAKSTSPPPLPSTTPPLA